jgi:hypothetical protein
VKEAVQVEVVHLGEVILYTQKVEIHIYQQTVEMDIKEQVLPEVVEVLVKMDLMEHQEQPLKVEKVEMD